MIRVTAPSRLHFGLFALAAPDGTMWPDGEGKPTVPARRFGGVGLMLSEPGIALRVAPAAAWSATGPSAERALGFARRVVADLSTELDDRASKQPGRLEIGRHDEGPVFAITVEHCPPEHVGLGTGTQLGLAVARGVCLALGQPAHDAALLARKAGRGLRSSLGIHGFQHGGFLIEGGKSASGAVAPLLARQPFPDDWRVLLIVPHGLQGAYGAQEIDAFAQAAPDLTRTEALARLALLGILPALIERDLPAFGAALYDFNRRAGEWFAAVQGGVYAHPRVAELATTLRQLGIRGVGQSSWGPALFAVAEPDTLKGAKSRLERAGLCRADEATVCTAANAPGST
jgi:beta-ribofuranosylaminobenzene 5'-phosphate synthase